MARSYAEQPLPSFLTRHPEVPQGGWVCANERVRKALTAADARFRSAKAAAELDPGAQQEKTIERANALRCAGYEAAMVGYAEPTKPKLPKRKKG